MAPSGAPPAPEEKAKRVRDLLSSYYGSNGAEGGDGTLHDDGTPHSSTSESRGSQQPSAARTAGLDSSHFEVDRYLSQLLRTTPMEALLTKHVEMSTEIKTLDSDMQMLVYENYAKFISATDTIRSMKVNVEGMDASMQDLRVRLDSVETRSNGVNSKLAARRDHVEELNQVRGLLWKLQAVFDLPRRLHSAIDNGAYEIAVKSYADAEPLLKRYGHKGAFRKVAAEADACAKSLTTTLRGRLQSQACDAAECVHLMRALGEPVENLQEDFLVCMKARLAAVLKEAEAARQALATGTGGGVQAGGSPWAPGPAGGGLSLGALMVQLDQRFLTQLAHTAAHFAALFPGAPRKQLLKVCKDSFNSYQAIVKRTLQESAQANALAAVGFPSAGAASVASSPAAIFGAPPVFGAEWGSEALTGALQTVVADVGRLHTLLPELSPRDKGAEIAEKAVRQHVEACFAALDGRLTQALAAADSLVESCATGDAGQVKLVDAVESIGQIAARGAQSLVAGVKVYQAHAWAAGAWGDVFADLVQGQLQQLFLTLLQRIVSLSGVHVEGVSSMPCDASGPPGGLHLLCPATVTAPSHVQQRAGIAGAVQRPGSASATGGASPALLLLLARLCVHLESAALPCAVEAVASAFGGAGGGLGADQPPAFVAAQVSRTLDGAAQGLLNGYVEAHGRRLSRAVAAASAWPACCSVSAPRPLCDQLLQLLEGAEGELAQLIAGEDRGGRHGDGSRGASSSDLSGWESSAAATGGGLDGGGGAAGGALLRSVSRMFREKVQYFGGIEFSGDSILAGILKVGLKSIVEDVRCSTLGRAALQQLQLDVHYLRPLLRRYAGGSEATAVQHLVDEALTAGVERALEPALLQSAALDRMLPAR